MKNVILKIVIVLSGTILATIKYNGFDIWNVEGFWLSLYTMVAIVLFIGSIIAFNSKKSIVNTTGPANKPEVTSGSNRNISFLSSETNSSPKSMSNYKYYGSVLLGTLCVSNLLAYKFKKLDGLFLRRARRQDTKWEYEAYIDMIYSEYSFFHLKNVNSNGEVFRVFQYNWEVFIIVFVILLSVAIFIRQTIFWDKISSFFKRIKRVESSD